MMGSAYSFDHYAAAPDAEDRAGRVFNNKVEQVRQELWVSLPRTILLNTSYSLDIIEVMKDTSYLYAGFLQMPGGI